MHIKDLEQLPGLQREIQRLGAEITFLSESLEEERQKSIYRSPLQYLKEEQIKLPKAPFFSPKPDNLRPDLISRFLEISARKIDILTEQLMSRMLEKEEKELMVKRMINFIHEIDDPGVREIAKLRYLQGLPWRDIGERVGTPHSVLYKKYINFLTKLQSTNL